MLKKLVVLATVIVALGIPMNTKSVHAGKGGKKGGGNQLGWDRACGVFIDSLANLITSDGSGAYCDSGDGDIQVWADGARGTFRLQTSLTPGERGVFIDMSNCIAEPCTTPFDDLPGKVGYSNNFFLDGGIVGGALPELGQTANVESMALYLKEGDKTRWDLWFAGSGTESFVTVTAGDLNEDGITDYTLEVSPDSPVIVEEWIYTTKGKKSSLSDIVVRGELYVPFQLTFQQTGVNQ